MPGNAVLHGGRLRGKMQGPLSDTWATSPARGVTGISRNPSAVIRWAGRWHASRGYRPQQETVQTSSRRSMRAHRTSQSSSATVVCFTANPRATSKAGSWQKPRLRSPMPWGLAAGQSPTWWSGGPGCTNRRLLGTARSSGGICLPATNNATDTSIGRSSLSVCSVTAITFCQSR